VVFTLRHRRHAGSLRARPPIECFHMTSRRPYWCPKTIKRRPCWCPKLILWELNSFLMQTLSFVPINLHRCWPREWKHSIWVSEVSLATTRERGGRGARPAPRSFAARSRVLARLASLAQIGELARRLPCWWTVNKRLVIRELKQRRRGRQRERQKSNRFD